MHTLWTTGIVIAALALAAGVGAPLTAGILRWADRRRPRPGSDPVGDISVDQSESGDQEVTPQASGPGQREGEQPAQQAGEQPGPDAAGTGVETVDPGEILRGGLWIGILERLAVAGCILLAYPAGIAVVVAIKGLGRFSTLRDEPSSGVSERFLVGTLTSYLWAAAVAVAAVGALGAIP